MSTLCHDSTSFVMNDHVSITGVDREVPLTCRLLDLALLTVQSRDVWVQHQAPVQLFKVVLGKFLDRWQLLVSLCGACEHARACKCCL